MRALNEKFTMGEELNVIAYDINQCARNSGWWDSRSMSDVPQLLMLCVSELSEAMEADRKSKMDDHLPHRSGLEVELADCVIRILDMAAGFDLDIGGAIEEKLEYNKDRADHKLVERAKSGGKRY